MVHIDENTFTKVIITTINKQQVLIPFTKNSLLFDMIRFSIFIIFITVYIGCLDRSVSATEKEFSSVSARLDMLSERMASHLEEITPDSTQIPRALEADGSLIGTTSRSWTSGFLPGTFWQLYAHSNNPRIKEAAETWTSYVEKEKWDDHTHDLGFKLYCSFGKGYELNDSQEYKDIVVQASRTLIERYNETVGCIRSWDWNEDIWQFPVIIDNMMNLDMLFEATRLTGDSIFHDIAYQHALTTLDNHFRDDYSSYHVVVFDTISGGVIQKVTHQGYGSESSWSRGQAWGLYGFTMAYRWTGNKRFLDRARAISQYVFTHRNMPDDLIPYWDFDAPNIPDEPRDVSAAAVTASGLIELAQFDSDNADKYLAWVDRIHQSLSAEHYQSNVPPFLLDHSTGSVPGEFEVDVPIVYADYYYVESLLRRMAY